MLFLYVIIRIMVKSQYNTKKFMELFGLGNK